MSKRGQNEGSIRQRKDGTWEARYTIGVKENGKPNRKSVYAKTRKEVKDKLNAILLSLKNGTYTNSNNVLFIDWLSKWLETYAKPNIKLATYTSYETYIRGHLKPYFLNTKLQAVSAEMLQKFFNYKQNNGRLDNREGGLSAKTLKNIYNMLHASFKQAYINGLVQTNIVESIRTPKIFKKEMRVLTREEQNKLIHVARNYRLGIVVILDLFTGMRLGEILALRWCDVDLKGESLIVRNSIKRLSTHEKTSKNQNKTKLILDTPKSQTSYREIPLLSPIVKELKAHKSKQNLEKQLASNSYINKDFLFCNTIGEPYDQKTFWKEYSLMLVEAGLRDKKEKPIRNKIKKNIKSKPKSHADKVQVTFHTLRHTFATRAIEQGMEIPVLSKILGHADISTTLNKYCHAIPDRKRENMEKIECLYDDSLDGKI